MAEPSKRSIDLELIDAVDQGDVDRVCALLDDGADPNASTDGLDSALARAARSPRSNVETLRLLLERGACVDGWPHAADPLLRGSHQSDEPRIRALLHAGADANGSHRVDFACPVVLHELIRWASLALIGDVIDRGAEVKARGIDGVTALHVAVMHGRPDAAKFLVERGADPAARDEHGLSPLDWGAEIMRRGFVRDDTAAAISACLAFIRSLFEPRNLPPLRRIPSEALPLPRRDED